MTSRIPGQRNINPIKNFIFKAGSYTLELGQETKIMGIINVTPDSFSGDGCLNNTTDSACEVLKMAKKLIKEGADILDVGAESSRPGSKRISAKEEIKRVIPPIRSLAKKYKIPISIDTYKTAVAEQALDAGATIINNIKGCSSFDKSLFKMVKRYNAAVVLMHMQGTPQTMQKNIYYKNVITEIIALLKKSIENCLDVGIESNRIMIDPGIGFGKTIQHNLQIINRLSEFSALKVPLLIGTSRKSFIGKILNAEVSSRVWGSTASASATILNGAHVIRAHDVKETKETALVIDAIKNESLADKDS